MPLDGVKAGELRQLVEIQQNVASAADSLGNPIAKWVTCRTEFAKIEPSESVLASTKALVGLQAQPQATHVVTLYWWESLNATYRIKYGKRLFEIDSVTNVDERNIKNICVVRERKDPLR